MSQQVVVTLLGAMALLLGFAAGWEARRKKSLHDVHRICMFYDKLLMADIIQQHVYLDRPAIIYAALCDNFCYIGQTMQPLEKRIYQHARGTSGFDRIYGRKPESWQWFELETVPCTYRYAAERAWIERYKTMDYQLMNGNDGTEDGLAWEIAA